MERIGKGLLAGLAATIVLSALMVMKSMMGIMPDLDLAKMISGMIGASTPMVGWGVHFMIGVVGYGVAIAVLDRRLPGRPTVQGMILASVGWLIMMIMLMPMAGAGLFGINMGMMAPVMTLVLHLVFGAILGATYGALIHRSETMTGAHV